MPFSELRKHQLYSVLSAGMLTLLCLALLAIWLATIEVERSSMTPYLEVLQKSQP